MNTLHPTTQKKIDKVFGKQNAPTIARSSILMNVLFF